MAEFQSKFTGQEIENTIDKLRNWLAAGIDGTYPTVTISSVTYDVIWKVIPTPGAKCYGIGLDRSTGRPYEIYYDGSSYKATALDTNTDTKNTAGSTNSTSKLYLVGANTLAENLQTFANNQVYMADGTLYLTKTKDLSGVADNKPALIVGGTNTTAHIEIDADEIHAKASGTTVAPLYLNHDGGNTYLSGRKTYSDGTYLYSDNKKVSAEGHTHSFDTITNRGEAFLSWGGKNFSGTYGPIDAAMVPELGANRLAFMPADAVTIEYSRDGGATWTDYGPTDPQKADLFNGRGASFTIGKATSGAGNIATNKYQLRVNIYTGAGRVYTVLNKFVIYLATIGTNNNWCTIRARTQSDYIAGNDKWTTFADKISVSGWSGYNVINTSGIITYGNTSSSQYGHIQFIFGCDTGSTNNSYAGLNINKIFGFGGVGWVTPSTMAKTGHMYTYDSSQNVTFPEDVSAKSFTEGGKSLASKYAAKSHTHNYAGSDSAGGPANSVKNALTFGNKKYDGSSAQTITLADLGGQAAGNYVTTDTTQTISGAKTFTAQPIINTSNGLKFTSGNCTLRIYNTSASPTDYAAIEARSNNSTKRCNLFIDLDINSLVVGPASGTTDTAYKVDVKDTFNATTIYENGTALSSKYVTTDKVTDTVESGSTDVVTSGAVHKAINDLPAPMIYKGTLGTGGTITALPTASSSNEGFTYKVITASTYASQSAKVGDVFISNGSAWTLIPAGDDVEDTWRQINVNGAQFKGTGISTGLVNFKDGSNVNITTSGNDIIVSAAVNNGTLTIQKNGTAVQTFTANQSSNVTANITVPTKTSDIDNDSGYVTGPSSSTANAVPRYDGTTGKIIKNTGVTISDANVLSAAQLAANIIETGAGNNNYLQSRKFRGEGNAATYYHAVDFGFVGHDRVDFYEYGGLWNFWKNTDAAATTADSNLCLQIGDTYIKNKGNTFTWPTTSGTVALKEDIPTEATAADNILHGSNNGMQITYAPYAAQQSKLSFDTSTTAPTRTDRLNLNGYLYATRFNVAGKAAVQYNSTEDCIEFIFA